MILSEFTITGIYGKYNTSLKIVENKLILVAKNGAGKTTILKLIFYFLTKQWENLATIEFGTITATINDRQFFFSREKYFKSESFHDRFPELAKAYPIYGNFISNDLRSWTLAELREKSHYVELLAETYDMPAGLLAKFIEIALASHIPKVDYDWEQYIIYLPTYRRIEEDFVTIFSDISIQLGNYVKQYLPDEIISEDAAQDEHHEKGQSLKTWQPTQIFHSLWSNRDREKWLKKKDNLYLELVEFGMDDISYKISEIVQSTKDPEITKSKISRYLEMCNKYLQPEKRLEFEENTLRIVLNDENGGILDLEKLSSGEKQVVALFFHLFIEDTNAFVIIDEPEISLSLRWQEDILSDILEANVTGLVVATHSPFVIGKQLEQFAHSINEFIA
jgi:energy-coupling factor transporter ATP-binding protein EcfA2